MLSDLAGKGCDVEEDQPVGSTASLDGFPLSSSRDFYMPTFACHAHDEC
jgi:hypothetical protein